MLKANPWSAVIGHMITCKLRRHLWPFQVSTQNIVVSFFLLWRFNYLFLTSQGDESSKKFKGNCRKVIWAWRCLQRCYANITWNVKKSWILSFCSPGDEIDFKWSAGFVKHLFCTISTDLCVLIGAWRLRCSIFLKPGSLLQDIFVQFRDVCDFLRFLPSTMTFCWETMKYFVTLFHTSPLDLPIVTSFHYVCDNSVIMHCIGIILVDKTYNRMLVYGVSVDIPYICSFVF